PKAQPLRGEETTSFAAQTLLRRRKPMSDIVTPENQPEYIGQMSDIVEHHLTETDEALNNTEIRESIDEGEDQKYLAIIFGSDYGSLQDSLTAMLTEWHVLP